MVPLDLTKKVGSELLPRKEKQCDTGEKKEERKGERVLLPRKEKQCDAGEKKPTPSFTSSLVGESPFQTEIIQKLDRVNSADSAFCVRNLVS